MMLLDPWCTIYRQFRSEWLWPQGKPESRQPAWLQCSSSGLRTAMGSSSHSSREPGDQRGLWAGAPRSGRDPQCHRELPERLGVPKSQTSTAMKVLYIYSGWDSHDSFMLSIGNREKQAPWERHPDGFLWQTDEPSLKACSLFDCKGWLHRIHSSVLCGSKNWKLLHHSELDSIFQIYTLSRTHIYSEFWKQIVYSCWFKYYSYSPVSFAFCFFYIVW